LQADEQELLELRRSVSRFKTEARKNGEAWRRSQAGEVQLLEAETLSALLGRLTGGLRETYGLHTVTLAVADPQHEIRRLLLDQGVPAAQFPAVSFVDDVHLLAPRVFERSRPWLGPFNEADHGRLFDGASAPRSVAILPMLRQRGIVASLNFGSTDRIRFTPKHGTEFLEHLGVIAAYCLDNTVNRAKLTRSGFTDALTGWHNRRYLQTRLQEELARSHRERTSLVCLMLDIDHFKRVNDQHGHLVGDDVLRQLAQRASREVRASDIAARYGGEEFVILLPATELDAGMALAERIREAIGGAPFAVRGVERPLTLSVSIGIAAHRPDKGGTDLKLVAESLVMAADFALYEAKAGGRDRVALAVNGS
jgi:diguanylate cyclase (GGDEF)-like protein